VIGAGSCRVGGMRPTKREKNVKVLFRQAAGRLIMGVVGWHSLAGR